MTSASQAVVDRIDHLIIRIDDPYYQQLYALLSETLQLPATWAVTQQLGFKSGGIFAGNVDFEILRVGHTLISPPPVNPRAGLYGIVFESHTAFDHYQADLQELARRKIPYIPSPYGLNDPETGTHTPWVNIFLGQMLGSSPWQRIFFLYKRIIPDPLWLRLAASGYANNQGMARFVFNHVYPHGIVFTVKYNPSWGDFDRDRKSSAEVLSDRSGGPLGLLRVKGIVVGCRDYSAARSRWKALLAPHPLSGEATWQVGGGPTIQLVPHSQDRLLAMIWQVRSLAQAQAFLQAQGLLGPVLSGELCLQSRSFFGLDIRLVA